MSNVELIFQLYKPYRITKMGHVYIMDTMEGIFVLKESSFSYPELYDYLFSHDFTNVPKLMKDSRKNCYVFQFEKDVTEEKNQKFRDLCGIVSLLHHKTSYFKKIAEERYEDIYNSLSFQMQDLQHKYEANFDTFVTCDNYSPAVYLFLRNYSLFSYSFFQCKKYLEEWFLLVKEKNQERVCYIHNDLKLEHYIKNDNNYIISWEKSCVDTPVLDIFHLYQNEFLNVDIQGNIDAYFERFSWNQEEKMLFLTLILMPKEIDFNLDEYELCKDIRRLIIYYQKSLDIVSKMAIEV